MTFAPEKVTLCRNCNSALCDPAEKLFLCDRSQCYLCAICASLHAPKGLSSVASHDAEDGCILCKPDEWAKRVHYIATLHLTLVDCNNVPRYSVFSVPFVRRSPKQQIVDACRYFEICIMPSACGKDLGNLLCAHLRRTVDVFFDHIVDEPLVLATHTFDTETVYGSECSGRIALVCNTCSMSD